MLEPTTGRIPMAAPFESYPRYQFPVSQLRSSRSSSMLEPTTGRIPMAAPFESYPRYQFPVSQLRSSRSSSMLEPTTGRIPMAAPFESYPRYQLTKSRLRQRLFFVGDQISRDYLLNLELGSKDGSFTLDLWGSMSNYRISSAANGAANVHAKTSHPDFSHLMHST